jgi:hypothetical protein
MFETSLWRGRRAIPQEYAASCCGSRSPKKLFGIHDPGFEFPNSLIGREQFSCFPRAGGMIGRKS